MKTNLVETAVGAVVILIAAAFFTFAYTTSGIGKGSGGYSLVAEFDNADGIQGVAKTYTWNEAGEFEADPLRDIWMYEWSDDAGDFVSLGLLSVRFVSRHGRAKSSV